MRYLILFLFFLPCFSYAQLSGKVVDTRNEPIVGVNVIVKDTRLGTVTDENGLFSFAIDSATVTLVLSHVGYNSLEQVISQTSENLVIVLSPKTSYLDEVEISGDRQSNEVSVTKLNPKSVESLPTPFREFNRILVTLPGVASNNELTSAYSVRGGNYDENLIYVNDIPIYRPFLVSNGQQEGLSFINPDLVSSVDFSAGGWQPKYGDKLASVLNVQYVRPSKFGGSIRMSLLGGSMHLQGATQNKRMSYALGVRHKSAQYLLNTLEVEGQYLPRFTDYQGLLNFNLGTASDPERTTLSILTAYARNRYFVEPENRETEFGNFNQSLRLFVAFDGQETLEYDTYQVGTKLTHQINTIWKTKLMLSGVYASEREYTEIEGGYRLCDVDKNLSSASFNDCVFIRGIGTNYDYGRNNLTAELFNAENRNEIELERTSLEFGFGYSRQLIEDQLNEYAFVDSVQYVVDLTSVRSEADLNSDQFSGFLQSSFPITDQLSTTVGIRLNYWNLNEELLFSPRAQFVYQPTNLPRLTINAAVGVYQQPPFYREMRAFDGTINTDLLAQKSTHFILGAIYDLTMWGRPFIWSADLYYKRLDDLVPYEVENVKVRYYATNSGTGYATGMDMRLSGEFIPGAESWFSLGLLRTEEDVEGDGNGYIRRPTDQTINAAIFFQDHIPNNPDIRVNLNLLYGSGLPFGPPEEFSRRNSFNGGSYTRLDIGFSRILYLNPEQAVNRKRIVLNAEILNLLGRANPISYTWINDVNNNQYAVPNALSARFFNVRASFEF